MKAKSGKVDNSNDNSMKKTVTFNADTIFFDLLTKAKNNPLDEGTSLSHIFRSLIITWLESGMNLDNYLVLTNYLSTLNRKSYKELALNYDKNFTPTRPISMTLSHKLYQRLSEAKIAFSNETTINNIYYKLGAGWIVSELSIAQYCSLLPDTQKIHVKLRDEINRFMNSNEMFQ